VINWQTVTANEVALSGVLSQTSLMSLMPIAQRLQGLESEIRLDLSGLSLVDTAGLAFLIELKAVAEQQQLSMRYIGASAALDKLVSLYNAQSLLE